MPRLRPLRVILAPALTIAALAVALAPDEWMRACAAAVLFAAVYLAGWRDGRRDLSGELLGAGGDRPPRTTRPRGPDAPDSPAG
jgi:hypothetical protein